MVMREIVTWAVKVDSEPERVEVRQRAGERPSQTAGGKVRMPDLVNPAIIIKVDPIRVKQGGTAGNVNPSLQRYRCRDGFFVSGRKCSHRSFCPVFGKNQGGKSV
jgi:hypothetical protein